VGNINLDIGQNQGSSDATNAVVSHPGIHPREKLLLASTPHMAK
jgi:hypothetical protein